MLQKPDDWKKISNYVIEVMKKKKEDERVRRAHPTQQVVIAPRRHR